MKTALITGSTRGIGKQVGIDLLKMGYYVYFNGHSKQSCYDLSVELKNKGNFTILKDNLSDIGCIKLINKYTLKLDVLILNAGTTDRTKFGKVSQGSWNRVFDMNLTIPFFLVQELKDKIKRNGKIIFISSIAGCTTDSTSVAYGVSKGAVHVLVPYLAKEFADKSVTVNAIAPGYVDTNWHIGKSKAQIRRIERKHLSDRLGTTKEISKAALSIIDNDFINAQVIRVDGGFGLL